MNESRSYYLKKCDLLIEYFSEADGHESFLDLHEKFSSKVDTINNYSLLIDIRDWDIQTNLAANQNYIQYFTNSKRKEKIRKIAFLTNTPDQVVQAMLFKDGAEKSDHEIRIFSSIKPAITWLCTGICLDDADKILGNFRKKSA
ncbi:hypothetical protein [Ancylomarina longa]|uniref:STAS/SEC14 domain-containing protein n=1 Tax=Ancylomarina longa TaxID=2487017 RepID=A0A434AFG2_9BACT|nr:hypothetical protein [Ancylomarina longa]RUT73088.1 hypothetical protein DLK05_15270 [Ancylomarina longa]